MTSFSKTNNAPPSPIFIPFLFLENGFVSSFVKTSNAEKPATGNFAIGSTPPTITTSQISFSNNFLAVEKALTPEVQAVETQAAKPFVPIYSFKNSAGFEIFKCSKLLLCSNSSIPEFVVAITIPILSELYLLESNSN